MPYGTTPAAAPERSAWGAGVEAAKRAFTVGLPEYVQATGVGGLRLTPQEEAAYSAERQASFDREQKLLPGGAAYDFSSPGGVWKTLKENTLYSLPQMGAIAAGGIAGGLAGGPVGAIAGGTGVGTAMYAGQGVDTATEGGKKLTPDAVARITAVAPIQAGLDVASEMMMPGLGKIFGKFMPKFEGNLISRVGKHAALSGAAEGTTEAAQQVGDRAIANKPLTGQDAMREYVQAGAVGALMGGALGSFGGIRAKHPSATTNDDLSAAVDDVVSPQEPAAPQEMLALAAPTKMLALPAPPRALPASEPTPLEDTVAVDEFGRPSAVPSSTPFADVDDEQLDRIFGELSTRLATGTASQADAQMRALAKAEIQRRTVPEPIDIAPTQLALPAPPPTTLDEAGNPSARMVPEDEQGPSFEQRLGEMTKGLSGQFVKKLAVTDETDLLSQVHDEILRVEEKGAGVGKSLATLAKRVGLLDEQEAPTALFEEVAATKQASPTETGLLSLTGEDATAATVVAAPEALPQAAAPVETPPSRLAGTLAPRAAVQPVILDAPAPAPSPNVALNQGVDAPPLTREQVEPDGPRLTEVQKTQQALNNVIDTKFDATKDVSEVAALKQMVKQGAPAEQVHAAIEQVKKTGDVAQFAMPANAGELGSNIPDRPQLKPEVQARVDKEIAAYTAGTKTFAQLSKTARGVLDGSAPAYQGNGDPHPEVATRTQAAIEGKSAGEVAAWLGQSASSRLNKLAPQLSKTITALEKAGWKFDVGVVHVGDKVPARMVGARGYALWNSDAKTATVRIKGADVEGRVGMDPETIAHELVHAVTGAAINLGRQKALTGTPLGAAVDDLINVANAIIEHFNKRAARGELNDFERKVYKRLNNALDDEHEVLAWGLTDPAMQRYLAQIPYGKPQTVSVTKAAPVTFWDKIVDAVRRLFGLPVSQRVVVAQVLKAATALEGVRDVGENLMSVIQTNGVSGSSVGSAERVASPEGFQQAATKVVDAAKEALRTVGAEDTQSKLRKVVMGFNSVIHMASLYKKIMPAISKYKAALEMRASTAARLSQMSVAAQNNFFAMQKRSAKAAETTNKLMQLAAETGIDPSRPWSAQPWLHAAPNAEALKPLADEWHSKYNGLKKEKNHESYHELAAVNETLKSMEIAVVTRNLVLDANADPAKRIEGFDIDPTDEFRAKDALHGSPTAARAYWRGVISKQVATIEKHIAGLPNVAAKNTPQVKLLEKRLAEAKYVMSDQRAPYFHLGRFGDHFVTMRVRNEKGKPDVGAIDKIADALQKAGFTGAQISSANTNPTIFMRLPTLDQRIALTKLAEGFGEQGLLQLDDEGKPHIRQGERGNEQLANATGHADLLNRLVDSIRASSAFEPTEGMSDAEKAQLKSAQGKILDTFRMTFLDLLPDSSSVKSLVHRKAIMGYNADMVQNFAERARVASQSLAALASAPRTSEAFVDMRKQVNDAKHGTDPVLTDKRQSLFAELSRRHAERPYTSGSDAFDTLKSLNHTFYLGFSPSYAAVQFTQLPVLLWPELSKKHGFMRSASAIAKVTPMAFKIMKAVMSTGAEAGWRHAADATVTEKALKRAGLDAKAIEFLTHMINSGNIDIGNAAREIGRTAEGKASSKIDTTLRYASALGYYSETTTRLIAALSARELHGAENAGVHEYASDVVDQAMFNYSTWNTARQLGKMGFAGKLTPLISAFYQYSAQLTEKLYREMHTIMTTRGESRKEAARFLTGHLGGVMLVAGTLGWPMATAFARAAEKLKDLFDDDDQPADFNAGYRRMLADSFGKDAGEMIARGIVPRALGVDLSQRAGEQSLLPFTDLLTDRRKWSDAYKDWVAGATGAPANMLLNAVAGAGDILDGNFVDGMTKMVPLALKGPVKAYTMTDKGYVDTSGNKLPITPGANDILAQVLGFAPSNKAEYSDKRDVLRNRDISLGSEAKQLRKNLAVAIEGGDMETARSVLQEAQQFDAANPGYAVLPGMTGTLKRRAQARALAGATGLPLGVKMKDIAGAQQVVAY